MFIYKKVIIIVAVVISYNNSSSCTTTGSHFIVLLLLLLKFKFNTSGFISYHYYQKFDDFIMMFMMIKNLKLSKQFLVF